MTRRRRNKKKSLFYCLSKSVCLPPAGLQVVLQHAGAAVPLWQKKKASICVSKHSKVWRLLAKVGSSPLWFGPSCRPDHSLPSEVKWLCWPVGSSRTATQWAALCRKTRPEGFFFFVVGFFGFLFHSIQSSGFRGIATPLKCLLCWRRLMTSSSAVRRSPANQSSHTAPQVNVR